MAATLENFTDPFLDDDFAPLHMERYPVSPDAPLEGFSPGPVVEDEVPTVEAPAESEPSKQSEPAGPDVTEMEDGSTLTVERVKNKGWKGTIDTRDGRKPEVFYGNTEREMYARIAKGKAEATRHITKLTREIKLGAAPKVPAKPSVGPMSRELTADEKFEIRTAFQADPSDAMKMWLQKQFGLTPDDFANAIKDGREAKLSLYEETVARSFTSETPEYYPDPQNKNFLSLLAWLYKNKLGQEFSLDMTANPLRPLTEAGYWDVIYIVEAYEDLLEAGLLVQKPAAPDTKATAATAAPQPKQDERIDRVVRRPRAGLGIRPSVGNAPAREVDSDKPLSVEDFEKMSSDDQEKLLRDVRQLSIQSRRR